ncbi:bifunctional dTDP-4-dehydrorhamnose 3,5-epimerase/dTDP-4-dehydrorhamnose reductase-like [Arachis hypogaea]|uniref:bifunctional dTDP-4-dehydrorhamnose 3,5-epimerase/dTDP-4-dehydrorhamnose reductase-like n=1 Tax=Arachis hypogaea TaxID=3818 RepID=UPI003B20F4FE
MAPLITIVSSLPQSFTSTDTMGLLANDCTGDNIPFVYGSGRLENLFYIAAVNPNHVFNATGVTGKPNVDWCESHEVETIHTNVVDTLILADVCCEKGFILITYAIGCIFEYDYIHTLGSGVAFKEEDTPNFIGSFCSKTKVMVYI